MRDERGAMFPSGTKRAVVLVGFGSPDPDDVRPFLTEIFSDPVASPFMRWRYCSKPLVSIMAGLFARNSRARYRSIARVLDTRRLVGDLAKRLEEHVATQEQGVMRVVSAMRYGTPSLRETISSIAAARIQDVFIIPLFPQTAIATTGSIEAEVRRVCSTTSCYNLRVRFPGPWYQLSAFVMSWVDAIRDSLRAFPVDIRDHVHLLFSAHAIPAQHVVGRGDRYPEEVAESARLINDALGHILPMSIAYQSAPPMGKWTGPTIEEELQNLTLRGGRDCLIAPIGFLYDNIETLCDIDRDILPRAAEFGMGRLKRVIPPIGSPKLLGALASLVRDWRRDVDY